MRAVDPNQTHDFVFPEDEAGPEAERTVFHLNVLDVMGEAMLDDRIGTLSDEGYSVKVGSSELLTLDIGLAGVDNLVGADGVSQVQLKRDMTAKPISVGSRKIYPWSRGVTDGLSAIPKDKRRALAIQITKGPKPKEAEVKN